MSLSGELAADPGLQEAVKAALPRERRNGSWPKLLAADELSQVALAEMVLGQLQGRFLYCSEMRSPLLWAGSHYQIDRAGASRILVAEAIRLALAEAVDGRNDKAGRYLLQSLSSGSISSVLEEMKPRAAMPAAEFDQGAHLLNFSNGTVDLRTGKMGPHRMEDRLTKTVGHGFRSEADCPIWLQFLERIMGGGPDSSEAELDRATKRIEYLQKALGYSATGEVSEKAVFIPVGSGNNGKTTMLSTVLAILGDGYARLLMIDSIMGRFESANQQADLADLRGARFVMTSEAEDGQRLAAGRLKRITQGMGRIKATQKYQNPIEFAETHALWIDTNFKPRLSSNDEATWNRLHPIPSGGRRRSGKAQPNRREIQELLDKADNSNLTAMKGCMQAIDRFRGNVATPAEDLFWQLGFVYGHRPAKLTPAVAKNLTEEFEKDFNDAVEQARYMLSRHPDLVEGNPAA